MAIEKDPERENRIEDDVVVDCYDAYERSIGWHCYLDDRLAFPFQAECIKELSSSLLKEKERVKVTAMADQNDCELTMLVLVQWEGRSFAVSLSQLGLVNDEGHEYTAEAIADWHYWVDQDYCF